MKKSDQISSPPVRKLTIGELADELNISTRTIRYYEERGMISPGRTPGGQRFYTRRERGRLKLILRGKAAGFDLDEIKEVVSMYDVLPGEQAEEAQMEKLNSMIDKRVADLDKKLEELSSMKKILLKQKNNLLTHGFLLPEEEEIE
ncbi:MAG: MerR family transcriptional regulator [Chloroflexota bacterium]